LSRADYFLPLAFRAAVAWARAAKQSAGTRPSLRLATAPWTRDAALWVIGVAGVRVWELDFFDMISTFQKY
jgi:hypothetical protein